MNIYEICGKWLLSYQRFVGAFLSFRTVVHRIKTASPQVLAPRQRHNNLLKVIPIIHAALMKMTGRTNSESIAYEETTN